MQSPIIQYEKLVGILSKRVGYPAVALDKEFIFNFEYSDIAEFVNLYMRQARFLCFYEQNKEFPMPAVTKKERQEIYKKELYERQMILNDLKFATHIMMSKYNEPAESRRFMTTNDSCLSFAQVTIDPVNYRWVFVSRSTEVNKMLPSDLCTIGDIIHNWTNWFIDYSPENFNPGRGIRILFILNNPHYYK